MRIHRRERHRGGLGHLRVDRLHHPHAELLHRVAIDVLLVERLERVVLAQVRELGGDGGGIFRGHGAGGGGAPE
jgi:hypothetical protein